MNVNQIILKLLLSNVALQKAVFELAKQAPAETRQPLLDRLQEAIDQNGAAFEEFKKGTDSNE